MSRETVWISFVSPGPIHALGREREKGRERERERERDEDREIERKEWRESEEK